MYSIEGLEKGVVPWRKTWKGIYPMNAFSKHPYQGFNALLVSFVCSQSNYSYPFFGTFKQISEAGGRIKKGEKSCPVVYWKITEANTENEETDGENKEKRFAPFYNNIFNLQQAEGIDIEKYIPDTAPANNNPLAVCETVIGNMPNPPRITHNQSRAFYRPYSDEVSVPEIHFFDSSEEYYATMFHELAHSTGHSSRLNRFEDNFSEFREKSYNYEELIAEMAATFLSSHCGIEHTFDNSIAYLTGWAKFLKQERKTILFGAATKAQAAVNYILGKHNENKIEQIEYEAA